MEVLVKQSTSIALKQIGLYYSFEEKDRLCIWLKKLPSTKLDVEVTGPTSVVITWDATPIPDKILNDSNVVAAQTGFVESPLSIVVHSSKPLLQDKSKITTKSLKEDESHEKPDWHYIAIPWSSPEDVKVCFSG